MQNCFDFAVIGGGAAGMAASVSAAACGDQVLLIEKNNMLGRKIAASGNGRCNIMNSGNAGYYGDADFAGKVLEYCSKEHLIRFWNSLGIRLSEEDGGRMYPCTFHSTTVTDAYKISLNNAGVDIRLQTSVKSITKTGQNFLIRTDHETFKASRILIACGGSASPKLGGTESGYQLLADFGHSIVPVIPALCPLKTDQKSISGLFGIRTRCETVLKDETGRPVIRQNGEILFTKEGISGICIMQTARFARKGYKIRLDLTGRIFEKQEELIQSLIHRQNQIGRWPPETLLYGILVPKLSYAVVKQSGIDMRGRNAGDLTYGEIKRIAETCMNYTLSVTGSSGMEDAQVTAGGADCSMFDPHTMESDIVSGLHAAGEVLNVDGDCGGYNLMFATASGILAGLNGREEIIS